MGRVVFSHSVNNPLDSLLAFLFFNHIDAYWILSDFNTAIKPWLIFTNNYYIRKLSLDGKYYELIKQGFSNVVALDVHIEQNMMYVIDVGTRKLQRMYMNGTNLETLVWHNMPAPEGLAVDWIGE